MKAYIKLLTISTCICFTFLLVPPTHGQTLAKNEDWLKKQLNNLVKNDDGEDTPKFTFKGCQLNMTFDNKDKDVSIGMNMAWQLRDVRKISYKKEKNGHYTLLVDVPADKVNMAMNAGGFAGSFTTDGKNKENKDNITSFDLNTTDESLIRQIKLKLEESVQLCRQGRD